jgi:hypothetical protein
MAPRRRRARAPARGDDERGLPRKDPQRDRRGCASKLQTFYIVEYANAVKGSLGRRWRVLSIRKIILSSFLVCILVITPSTLRSVGQCAVGVGEWLSLTLW